MTSFVMHWLNYSASTSPTLLICLPNEACPWSIAEDLSSLISTGSPGSGHGKYCLLGLEATDPIKDTRSYKYAMQSLDPFPIIPPMGLEM